MDNYVKVKKIGEGSFGKALLVKRKNDNKQCVIKEIGISRMSPKEKEESRKEVKVLSQLKHPNIVTYLESFEGSGNLYIVMDYCEGGDLYEMIVNQRGLNLSENKVLDIFVQCCLAVKHIHDRKILHRDIKTQNIFLTKHHIVKLGDFGIARVLKNTMELARTCIGTPYYLSPEIVENRPYNNKSDIWSLGCVLYETATLKHAFEAGNMKALVMKIVRGSYPPLPNKYSHELRALVAHCFKRSPSDRPSITSLLRKPIIQQRISKFLTPEKLEEEFSHTIFHRQSGGGNPASRPISAVSNKRAFPAAKKAMDPALVYGVSVSKKPSPVRKPLSGLNKDQKIINKAPNNYKKVQDARERRRKELIAQEKQYQDYMKNLQEQRYQKQQQARINRDRETGWKSVLSTNEEVKPKDVSKKSSIDEEAKRIKTPHEEKPQQVVSKENVKPPYSAVEAQSGKGNVARMNAAKAIESADKERLLKEFWQRKNAAAANKVRGHQDIYGNPVAENPMLQFHNNEMAKQGKPNNNDPSAMHGAARNKQELNYLKQLEDIRKQNYKERKAVKLAQKPPPGQLYQRKEETNKRGDPRFDPEARKMKIEALKEQAEKRSVMLKEQLDLRRKQAVVRLEKERLERIQKNLANQEGAAKQNERIIRPISAAAIKDKLVAPVIGMNTAMNQVAPSNLFRSCSENDLQNIMKANDKLPVRKNWNVRQAPFEFANMPMEITSSAMEATVVEESIADNYIESADSKQAARKHWGAEGKTQLVSRLHNIELSGTKMPPTMQCDATINEQNTNNNKNNEDDISHTIVLKRSTHVNNKDTPNPSQPVNLIPQVNKTIVISSQANTKHQPASVMSTQANSPAQTIVISSQASNKPSQGASVTSTQANNPAQTIVISSQANNKPSQETSVTSSQANNPAQTIVISSQANNKPSQGASGINNVQSKQAENNKDVVNNNNTDKVKENNVDQELEDELVEEIFLLESETKPKIPAKNNIVKDNDKCQERTTISAWDAQPKPQAVSPAEVIKSKEGDTLRSSDNDTDKKQGEGDLNIEEDEDDENNEEEDSFHTPGRREVGLQTGCYDAEKKLLRTCSLPDLRAVESSPISSTDDDLDDNSEEAMIDDDMQVEDLDEDNMGDNEDDEEDTDNNQEDEDEEIEDYESMLESMRGVLNNTAHSPTNTIKADDKMIDGKETLVNNYLEADEEWESDEDSSVIKPEVISEEKKSKLARDNKLKDTLFSRIEESRKMLEDELGFDLFVKVYKHVQMIQDNEEEDNALEISTNEINDLLGEKDYLYQKILYLVMADTAYCEGNEGD